MSCPRLSCTNNTQTEPSICQTVQVFCVHGMPQQLLMDHGANYECELFKEIYICLYVDIIWSMAYKPSTNRNIEGFHSTLSSILAKWVSENHRDYLL